jgi:phospholipase/carboxylesterase
VSAGAAGDPPSLDYLERPAEGEPQGALVLLHGRGTDERDLFPLLDEIDPERRLLGIAPGAPLTGIPPGGRHWYIVERIGHPDPSTFHRSYAVLTGFLERLLAERGIGWERTVLGGFSMGAVMSYAVGLGPGRPSPAAIVALSGFVPQVEGWEPELEGRQGLPVLIHHGRLDPIIEVGFGRRGRELLEAGGLDVSYYESDIGHGVPPQLVPRLREFVAVSTATAEPRGTLPG